jgi:Zinc finger C-x8-C-x5-C-x3-H type (and similar)
MQPQLRPNVNYKTTLCNHFHSTGSCLRGENCHFAHGEADLRKKTDPLPENIPLVKFKTGGPPPINPAPTVFPSNYKTVMCKFYEKGNPSVTQKLE